MAPSINQLDHRAALKRRKWLHTTLSWTAIFLLVTLISLAEPAWACPTCKESLVHSDPDSANLVRGYFWSILFMMSMPFLILGGLSTYFYYEVCKARRLQAVSSAALPS